jgi:protein-S-isoprenylcysteine O-methyltransferase Ste14
MLAAAAGDGLVAQAAQIVGALLVLSGFAAVQFGRLRSDSPPYLAVNLAGSCVLAVLAAVQSQYGFLLLEGVWAVVSAWSIVRSATLARRMGR